MTNLFAAVFWLIATLINTGGNDVSLLLLPRDYPAEEGHVSGLPSMASVAPEQNVGDGLDVLPALPVSTVYSIPVYGLSNDGPVVPAQVTPTLVATMEAEAPKEVVCEWECILRSVGWPEYEMGWAGRVIGCESGFNPSARNPSGASGWWQVMLPLHQHLFREGEHWSDPYANSRVALVLYNQSGHTPWNASRHCWG